jgi:plasmid stabilization system protein ParE
VPDPLGWPEAAGDRLLDWGSANFDALGPLNARAGGAGSGLLGMAAAYAHNRTDAAPGELDGGGDPRCRGTGRHRIHTNHRSLGIELLTNARVLVTYTSANRDERCPDVICGSYLHSAADMRSIETV